MKSSPFPEETYSSDTSCEYNAVAPYLSDEKYIEDVTSPATICSDEDSKDNLEDCLIREAHVLMMQLYVPMYGKCYELNESRS